VHELLEIGVKGRCTVDFNDYVAFKIGECKSGAGEGAILKGCYQLYIRLAVLATVAYAITPNAHGTLLGTLYFREGIRDSSTVGEMINKSFEIIRNDITLPDGFEIKIDYEFL